MAHWDKNRGSYMLECSCCHTYFEVPDMDKYDESKPVTCAECVSKVPSEEEVIPVAEVTQLGTRKVKIKKPSEDSE